MMFICMQFCWNKTRQKMQGMSYLHSLIPDLQFHMINKQMLKYMFAFIRIVFSEKSSSNENRITRPIHVHLYTFMYHLILKSYSICTNYVLRSDHSCILSTYYASLCGITTGKKTEHVTAYFVCRHWNCYRQETL